MINGASTFTMHRIKYPCIYTNMLNSDPTSVITSRIMARHFIGEQLAWAILFVTNFSVKEQKVGVDLSDGIQIIDG